MKRLVYASILLGAFAFSSCVKDAESSSVTEIRNAKAAELNSIAALNNANAQAAIILANAQAALQKAQAELIVAQTEEQRLANELLKVQIDSARVELEAQRAEAEQRKAMAEAEIRRIAAQLEIDLLDAKAQLVAAQQAYIAAVGAYDTFKADEIMRLANAYTLACSDLYSAQILLVDLESQKSVLENTPESVCRAKEELVRIHNREIESIGNIIAALEGAMDMSLEEATIKLNEKYAEVVSANDSCYRALNRWRNAQTVVENAKLEITNLYPYYLNPLFKDSQGQALFLQTNFKSTQEVVSESGKVCLYSLSSTIAVSPYDVTSSQTTHTYGYDLGNQDYAVVAIWHPDLLEGMLDANGYACVNAEFNAGSFDRAAAVLKENARLNYEANLAGVKKTAGKNIEKFGEIERYIAKVDELLGDKPEKLIVAQQAADEAKAKAKTCKKALSEYVTLNTAVESATLAEATTALTDKQTALDDLNAQIKTAKTAMGTPEGYQSVVDLYSQMINECRAKIESLVTAVEALRHSMEENQAVVDAQSARTLEAKAAYDIAQEAYYEAKLLNTTDPSEEHAAAEAAALEVKNEKFALWQKEVSNLTLAETNLQTASSSYLTAQNELSINENNLSLYEKYLGQKRTEYETNKQLVDSLTLALPAATEAVNAAQLAYDAALATVEAQLSGDPEFQKLTEESESAAAAKTETAAAVTAIQTSIDNITVTAFPDYQQYVTDLLPAYSIAIKDDKADEEALMLAYEDILSQIDVWQARIMTTLENRDNYIAAITGLNELIETEKVALNEYTVLQKEYDALFSEYESLVVIAESAVSAETEIATRQQEIADLQLANQTLLTEIKTYESMGAYLDTQIAAQKEVIKAYEAAVKLTKDAMDRLIATE